MDFISTGLWWAFFVPASASFSVYTLARRSQELGMKRLNLWGGLCVWICLVLVILAFVFSGWKGGLAVIIGMVLISVIVVQATKGVFDRRPRIHGQEIKTPRSFEERLALNEQEGRRILQETETPKSWEEECAVMEQEDRRIDEMVSRISGQPKMLEILRSYGREHDYLKEVRKRLLLSGAGTYVAEEVIQSRKLLKQYLQMEADGMSRDSIAFAMLKSSKR